MLSPCSHHMTSSKGGVSGVVRLQGSKKKKAKSCERIVMIVFRSQQILPSYKESWVALPCRLAGGMVLISAQAYYLSRERGRVQQ